MVIASYAAYFHAQTSEWGLTRTTGNVLYGRAAVAADGSTLTLDPLTALACPEESSGQRKPLDSYAHTQPPGLVLLPFARRAGDYRPAGSRKLTPW